MGTAVIVPRGYCDGGRLAWVSASTLTLGTAAVQSTVLDSTGDTSISWLGTVSIDITVAGAGGLQTGSTEAADTWYGVYIIDDTSQVLTPTGLLIPDGMAFSETGYDVARLLGWVRNDSSSNFLDFIQIGSGHSRIICYQENRSDVRVLNGGSASTWTAVDCSSFVPPTAREILLGFHFKNGSSGAEGDLLELRTTGSTITNALHEFTSKSPSNNSMRGTTTILCNSNQIVDYKIKDGANNTASLHIIGYADQID